MLRCSLQLKFKRKRGVPKPPTIKKIADALKVEYEDLMIKAGYIKEEGTNVSVSGQDIKLTPEEIKFFEELKKYPILFNDLASDPEKKIKELIKLQKAKKLLMEDEEEYGSCFGDFED
jgi:hypothetical protein